MRLFQGKAAGKQNFGYVKCTTKKDKQKKINKKASIHKVKFLMNTRYGANVHIGFGEIQFYW